MNKMMIYILTFKVQRGVGEIKDAYNPTPFTTMDKAIKYIDNVLKNMDDMYGYPNYSLTNKDIGIIRRRGKVHEIIVDKNWYSRVYVYHIRIFKMTMDSNINIPTDDIELIDLKKNN